MAYQGYGGQQGWGGQGQQQGLLGGQGQQGWGGQQQGWGGQGGQQGLGGGQGQQGWGAQQQGWGSQGQQGLLGGQGQQGWGGQQGLGAGQSQQGLLLAGQGQQGWGGQQGLGAGQQRLGGQGQQGQWGAPSGQQSTFTAVETIPKGTCIIIGNGTQGNLREHASAVSSNYVLDAPAGQRYIAQTQQGQQQRVLLGATPSGQHSNVFTAIETVPQGTRITIGNGTQGNLLEHASALSSNYALDCRGGYSV